MNEKVTLENVNRIYEERLKRHIVYLEREILYYKTKFEEIQKVLPDLVLSKEMIDRLTKLDPTTLKPWDSSTLELWKQLINHYDIRVRKLREKKHLYPICTKCREIGTRMIHGVMTGRQTETLDIREHAMKRLYIKGYLYGVEDTYGRTTKKWYPIGWVCPKCLNIIIDKEILDKKTESHKKSEELSRKISESFAKILDKQPSS